MRRDDSIKIMQPGLMTSVQDLGRYGYQRFGIGPSGALDPIALRAANLLVGNDPGEGTLEVLYLGPTLEIEAENVRLSFAGANASIEILRGGSKRTGIRIQSQRSVLVKRGDIVKIGSLADSSCLYVGVEGGFEMAASMGSVSTNIRAGTGGWQARSLVVGDRLPLRQSRASDRGDFQLQGIKFLPPARLRAIEGPQHDYFSKADLDRFFENEYTVGISDRVGMRLRSENPLSHTKGFNIASDAIAPGSVQVPGDGQPIVLLSDRQTTGGYPKVATVISADLSAMGRLVMGAKIRFEPVAVEKAHALRRRVLSFQDGLQDHVVPLYDVSTPTLLTHNLISGVVDASHDSAD
ncbi:MAG: biotin-dependent carboxyltransferase family protein [Xanthobacteraceae bacterium]|nr:biotin-dependent carboxyltransferase family protein [Xanthobacteraceae bacterium]